MFWHTVSLRGNDFWEINMRFFSLTYLLIDDMRSSGHIHSGIAWVLKYLCVDTSSSSRGSNHHEMILSSDSSLLDISFLCLHLTCWRCELADITSLNDIPGLHSRNISTLLIKLLSIYTNKFSNRDNFDMTWLNEIFNRNEKVLNMFICIRKSIKESF